MESPKITIHVVEKSAQNHHQNCVPKITSHNQTQIEKEKEEEWEWEEEDEDAEDVRRRRKRKKEETRNKKKVENKEIESIKDILKSLVRWWDRWEIIIKSEKNYYLNKINDKIDKLIWVFCKNGCVK